MHNYVTIRTYIRTYMKIFIEQRGSTKLHGPAEIHGPTKDTVNPAYNTITE